ncbi:hypothetical protein ACFFIY_00450 [Bhargavaea ullalensis]|uniref:Multisubunit Na+/H+ antiporter MnhB subunit n=1 Tax=Bhargavaea ullalensis TaxID=1265685 RepID=A0ABV2GE53_9BACL
MYEGFEMSSFLAGLPLGIVITLIVFYFSWRKGKKERRFDERYKKIHESARSFSWAVTTFVLLIAWALVLFMEPPGTAFFVLMAVYMLHMISYGVGAGIAARRN